MDEDVVDILGTAFNSDPSWLSDATIVALAKDMKNGNSDTAMDEEFDALCDRVIERYSK